MLSMLSLPSSRNSSDTSSPSVSASDALNRPHRTSSQTPIMSMVSRVQARDDELRRHFGLASGELFMDEFYCALHKKILLQGRMYVFENYVCFYSNLFGWVKRKVIPLVEVSEISKKRHYGFPNSIRIVWNGKKEFFTSFLSREDAYALLINVWNQAQLAAQTLEPGPTDSFTSGLPSVTLNNSAFSDSTNGDGDSGEDLPMPEPPMLRLRRSKLKRQSWDSNKDIFEVRGDGADEHASGISEGSEEEEEEDDDNECHWEATPAPPIPSTMQCIIEEDLNATVPVFFEKIFSDASAFFEEVHKARGDQRFQTSPWQSHSQVCGRVRHMTFVSLVKSRLRLGCFTPSKTACTQNQRCCMYTDHHLVFESSQVHTGLPYGDCFQVRTRWDVTPLDQHASASEGCHLRIHAEVPFTRSVLGPIRLMINTGVFKELREATDRMVVFLRETFAEEALSDREGSEGSLDGEEGESPDGVQELLKHADLRQWVVQMVREELGETASLSPGKLPVSISSSRRGQRGSEGGRAPWPGWPRIGRGAGQSRVVLMAALAVLFVLQILNLMMFFSPSRQCTGGSAVVGTLGGAGNELVGYLSHVQEDLERLQKDLEGLVQAVSLGIGHITKVVDSFELG
ncbi:unnamed protein product [Ostreobium quekettii]|uniref:VASt domain-containing protein n=1 Tax=Ostreobium quekettii TaxID=121088 RepID=A0A8S1J7A1_9CHLO|nr:unnamed protein product [Ostreobium quekettii]|eukprot:evm.model.scf_682EXC.1 EVM.evm.TU.scf_682EXC.1   scf_682EXC:6798-10094(+)